MELNTTFNISRYVMRVPCQNLCADEKGRPHMDQMSTREWKYLPLNNDCIERLFLLYEYSYAFACSILLKTLFDKYHIRKALGVFGYMYVF